MRTRGAGERLKTLFSRKLFREEAVARRSRPEPLDERLQVTAPHEWMVLVGIGLAMLAFLLWGVFGSVERSLSVPAVLVAPGERYAVVSPVSGTVIETMVEIGDAVEAGQVIARVRVPEAERQAQITRRIVGAVEDGIGRTDAADATETRQALLAAARDTLAAVELLAGESIVARRSGTLVSHGLIPGQPVRAGETVAQVRERAEGPWQALAFVASPDAAKLTTGMDAAVIVALPEQPGSSMLTARVLEVSGRTVVAAPAWLEDLGLATSTPAHLLRLVLSDPQNLPLADGAGGVARVVLGEQSLAALLLASGRI